VARLRPVRTNAVVGLEIDPGEQRGILERLGFEIAGEGDEWRVTVPTWRARDVTREIDLVEEIARFRLDDVPFTLPVRRAMFGRLTQDQRLRRLVEDVMAGCGFSEAYTWSLVARDPHPDALRLPVPLSADHAILRTTLVEGLVGAARHNADLGNDAIALFEVARVYLPSPSGERLPDERWHLGGICEGGYFRAKGAVEALHEALGIEARFERATDVSWLHRGAAARLDAGVVGELHPTLLEGSWGIFELDLATLFDEVPERVLYEDVVTYPALRQDLAFVVPEDVLAGDLVQTIREAAGEELREARVFDVYRGAPISDGSKSIALHVVFQSSERTLSDDDAGELRERIMAAVAERLGGELRA
jgi:phenylalanyl-tRNA synthetase beta chain